MKVSKILLIFCLTLALCLLILPTQADAASQSDLTFTLNNDGESYSVTDCDTSVSGSLVIPETYNGKPVTTIGPSAFYKCESLTCITIPDSITAIKNFAFEYCKNLKEVHIFDLGAWCGIDFESNYSNVCYANPLQYGGTLYVNGVPVESLTIQEEMTEIGDYAFCGYDKLKSVMIPTNVTSIGESAFYGCTGLTELTISASVRSIGESAFYDCTGLTELTIPEGVVSIESEAFSGCVNLKEAVIPKSVTKLSSIFSGCERLEALTIPCITYEYDYPRFGGRYYTIGYLFGGSNSTNSDLYWKVSQPYYYWQSGLGGMTKWGEYHIPKSLKTITVTEELDESAFENCVGFEKVIFAEGVTGIASSTFYNCVNLKQIVFPDSMRYISADAFVGCENLEYSVYDNAKYLGNEENPYLMLISSMSGEITSCEIHPRTKAVANNAFANCEALTAVTVSGDLAVGGDAFGKNVKKLILKDGVTQLTSGMLVNTYIEELVIPASVTEIEKDLLYNLKSLKNIYYKGSQQQWREIEMSSMDRYGVKTVLYDMCLVTFQNWDGTVLGLELFPKGAALSLDVTPTKEADETYTYTFSGWDMAVCTGDLTATAQYTASYKDYTVSFYDEQGNCLQTDLYHYGQQLSVPEAPVKPYNDTHYYIHSGWSPDFSGSCTGNAEYTAVYTELPRQLPETPGKPFAKDATPTSVTLEAIEGLEYSLDGITWQDSSVFKNLQPETSYTFYQRVKETAENYASAVSPVLSLKTPKKLACPIPATEPVVAHRGEDFIELVAMEGYEYRLGNGFWTSNPLFSGLEADQAYTICQRIAETGDFYAGEPSRSVTVKTWKAATGVTSESNYWKLREYISQNATNAKGTQIEWSANSGGRKYTYKALNGDGYIQFSISSVVSTGYSLSYYFNLYPDTSDITLRGVLSFLSTNGYSSDAVSITVPINRATYTSSTTFQVSLSMALLIPEKDASTFTTQSMLLMIVECDNYLYRRLGFGMSDLGFVAFNGMGDTACDLPSGTHKGSRELRDVLAAGCTYDGYTGDYYCTACNHKVETGSRIPAKDGHTYDNDCDDTCNDCGQVRIADHTFVSACDRTCQMCDFTRKTDVAHTYEAGENCDYCGASKRLPGDIDGNEEVATDDVVALLLYITMPDVFPLEAGVEADFDGDSTIGTEDAVILLLHISMPDMFPLA